MLDISRNINHYQTLCESIPQVTPNSTDIQNNLLKVRKKELYDVYVNKKHSEISTGDIFITRLNELNTIDLLKEYGNMSSRVGHPFDFMKKDEILE